MIDLFENVNELSFAEAKSSLMDSLEDSEFTGVETVFDDTGEEAVGLRFSNGTLVILTEFYVVSEFTIGRESNGDIN